MDKPMRNTKEIVRLAKQKNLETKKKVEKILSKLSLEGKPINFNSVSKEANVSKSWLYKEPEVRKRIENLRQQQINNSVYIQKNKRSMRSEEILIKTLKERIKKVEDENIQLKKQVEKLFGELYSRKK
ncbi:MULTISPECIES: DUF6262 family protein [Bacillaceae]|uniref:DUF6262 family protein n=1 Tax=Bacillaceae TaxID=186817 RepID=UPI002550A90E|nr:DUF6262 family protein [Niallia taxi]MDK8643854.1 DUF6262 family protein [Niallia taxi]